MHTPIRTLVASAMVLLGSMATARADDPLGRIALEILADKFGVSLEDASRVRSTGRLSMEGLAPVLSASFHTRSRAEVVMRLRQEGLGWGQIAHRLGMHPGTFNKLRKEGAFDSGSVWSGVLRGRFEVSAADIAAAQERKASPQEIIAAILIAKAADLVLGDVLDARRKAGSWEPLCRKYGVDFEDWRRHDRLREREADASKVSVGAGLGKSTGKGKGKGGEQIVP